MATTAVTNGLTAPPTTMCTSNAELYTLIGLCVIWPFAIAVTIFLAIIQKRTRFRPEGFYKGRPGLPIPIDFLISPRQRVMYSILFGVMGTGILTGFGNFRIGNFVRLEGDDPYTKVLNKILWTPFFTVLDLVLRYFPLFATVGFPYIGLGYTVGFIYSIVWFLAFWIPHFIYYDELVSCTSFTTNVGRSVIVANVMRDLPLLLLSVLVVFWYAYRALFYCVWKPLRKKRGMSEDLDDWRHGVRHYHLDRVKHLLIKKVPKTSFKKSNKIFKLLHKIRKYLFPFKRNYKLPLPLVGAIVAMVLLVYQLSCGVVSLTFILLSELAPYYTNELKPGLDSLAVATNSSIPLLTSDIAGALFIGVPVVIALAPFGAVGICVFLLIHMVASISKQIKKVSKVGFSEALPERVRRVSGVWRYIGLQIGLFITSWVIFSILFAIIGLVLIFGFFCLKYPAPRNIVLNIGIILLIPVVWAQLLWFLQNLISKHVFVADKGKDNEAKFIPVNNRRLYNWFAFVLFFYNGFAGLVGAVQRILFNVVFGLVLLFRLDKLSIPAEFAWWDFGHKAYLSFIYLDYCYNNPVVHVFLRLLENSIHTKQDDKTLSNVELVGADQLAKPKIKNVQARNRWLVAYTLIRNPSLQKLTASNIQLLQASAERDKKRVFSLEHTIRSFSQEYDDDVTFDDVFVKKTEEVEVDIGTEIKSVPEEVVKSGEDVVQRVEPGKNEVVSQEDDRSDVPYQRWS